MVVQELFCDCVRYSFVCYQLNLEGILYNWVLYNFLNSRKFLNSSRKNLKLKPVRAERQTVILFKIFLVMQTNVLGVLCLSFSFILLVNIWIIFTAFSEGFVNINMSFIIQPFALLSCDRLNSRHDEIIAYQNSPRTMTPKNVKKWLLISEMLWQLSQFYPKLNIVNCRCFERSHFIFACNSAFPLAFTLCNRIT